MSDQQQGHEAECQEYLSRGRCPANGLRLRLEQWPHHGPTMACSVCDCFGYNPDEVGDG